MINTRCWSLIRFNPYGTPLPDGLEPYKWNGHTAMVATEDDRVFEFVPTDKSWHEIDKETHLWKPL